LCRWIVYSLATTSAIADRVFFPVAAFFGWVLGLSLAIATVWVQVVSILVRLPLGGWMVVKIPYSSMAIDREREVTTSSGGSQVVARESLGLQTAGAVLCAKQKILATSASGCPAVNGLKSERDDGNRGIEVQGEPP
jgi:hypothetical protein